MGTLAAILLCVVPFAPIPTTTVDEIEENHVFDSSGNHSFTQLIFENHEPRLNGRSGIVAWVMEDGQRWRFRGGYWVGEFYYHGELVRVRARFRRTTWTMYDREVLERGSGERTGF